MSEQDPIRMFISYSRKDKEYTNPFIEQLIAIKLKYTQFDWDIDTEMYAGAGVDDILLEEWLPNSDIACMLVSPSFIRSEYIYKKEIPAIAERWKQGNLTAIPIIIRDTNDWQDHGTEEFKLGRLNAIPEGAKHLNHKDWNGDQDAYWNAVGKKLKTLVGEISEKRAKPGKNTIPTLHFSLKREDGSVRVTCDSDKKSFPPQTHNTEWDLLSETMASKKKYEILFSCLFGQSSRIGFQQLLEKCVLIESAGAPDQQPCRLILKTDDADIASLPWLSMTYKNTKLTQKGWIIIVISGDPLNAPYELSHTINNALLIAAYDPEVEIQDNPHMNMIEAHLDALFSKDTTNLALPNPIFTPRNAEQIEAYFDRGMPLDFLYIYARLTKEGEIRLRNEETLSLEKLAELLKQSSSRPIVFVSLFSETNELPDLSVLIQQSMLLAAQITRFSPYESGDLLRRIAKIWVAALSTENDDMALTICKHADVSSRYWQRCAYVSLNTTIDENQRLRANIRATLLQILLGREEEKEALSAAVKSSKQRGIENILTYCVIGENQGCPHDFPNQIKEKLRNQDDKTIVRNCYIPHRLNLETNPEPVIRKALKDALLKSEADYESSFRRMFPGIDSTDTACIGVAWLIEIPEQLTDIEFIKHWLSCWRNVHQKEFSDSQLDTYIILAGVCIESNKKELSINDLFNESNNVLKQSDPNLKRRHIDFKYPLAALSPRDLLIFFNSTKLGQRLKPEQCAVEDLANWLLGQHNGMFLPTVDALWKAIHNSYREYKIWREKQ